VSEIYKRPQLFAWVFAGIGLWMAICTLTNSRLSLLYGARKTLRGLLMAYTIIAALLLGCTLLFGNPPQIALFAITVAFMLGINVAIEPNSSALAMQPMGHSAGLASSIYGTSFFFIGAAAGSVISSLMQFSVMPLIVGFFVIGIITLVLAFRDRQ
jgi:DHA1 family bicyclomycin/chloramphenicol resistance-like MFS transporter